MLAQTPVQIAWVARDLDATEAVRSSSSKECWPACGAHMSGPPAAGLPYLEITYVAGEVKAFFDHIGQEQQ